MEFVTEKDLVDFLEENLTIRIKETLRDSGKLEVTICLVLKDHHISEDYFIIDNQ
jgi:hypothetical protein